MAEGDWIARGGYQNTKLRIDNLVPCKGCETYWQVRQLWEGKGYCYACRNMGKDLVDALEEKGEVVWTNDGGEVPT